MNNNEIAQRLLGTSDVGGEMDVEIKVLVGTDPHIFDVCGFEYDPDEQQISIVVDARDSLVAK